MQTYTTITPSNLTILAEAKEDVAEYLRHSVDADVHNHAINHILSTHSDAFFLNASSAAEHQKKLQAIQQSKTAEERTRHAKKRQCNVFSLFYKGFKRVAQCFIEKNNKEIPSSHNGNLLQ